MTDISAILLDQLRRTSADPDRRVLITGGTVLTMDPTLGILPIGDVLIHGSTITAVAPNLRAQGAADGAIVIDATRSVLTPGFVDTHRHAWQAQLRRIMPDVNDLGQYVASTLANMALAYRPHDKDFVRCGAGEDEAQVDPEDDVGGDCERVDTIDLSKGSQPPKGEPKYVPAPGERVNTEVQVIDLKD